MANEDLPAAAIPETTLRIDHVDILDRIKDLARDATRSEIVTIAPPPGYGGLPKHVPILLKHGANDPLVSVAALFEPYRIGPAKIEGTSRITTLASFVELVDRHKSEDSVIFAKTSWPDPSLTAVIDYNTRDHQPRFGKHRISYAFPLTEEFKAWVGQNGKSMSQGDFAAFVEDHIADLASPTGGEEKLLLPLFKTLIAAPNEMMELSRGLQIRVASVVKNAVTLKSGEGQILWQEEHQDEKGAPISVPGLFIVCVPAFVDGDPIRIAARLRYKVSSGKITWSYHLYKWDFELRNRVKADLDQAAGATTLPAFEGSPEA